MTYMIYKKLSLFSLFTLVCCLLLAPSVLAQTRYISDELYVPLRAGQGNQYRIVHRGLPSGTPLELIEEGEEWSQVRTEDGTEGWIRNQYLQNEPIAETLLQQAQARIATLTNRQENLGQETSQLEQRNQELQTQVENLQAENQRLVAELEEIKRVSSNTLELNQRHQELLEEHQILQTQLDVAQAENERLERESQQTWFLYGAIAVGLGVILTLIAQSVKSRRRYSEWAN